MAKVLKLKQLTFIVPNRVGLLSEVTTFLANGKINIEALCAYGRGEEGVFRIVTNNNAKAKKILTQMGAEVKTEEVIAVELANRPGELQKVAKKVSEADVFRPAVDQFFTDVFVMVEDAGLRAQRLSLLRRLHGLLLELADISEIVPKVEAELQTESKYRWPRRQRSP